MRAQVAYMAQCTEPAASNGHAITSRQIRSRRGAARGRVAAACCRHAAALSRVQQAGLIHVLQQGGGVCLVNVETLAFRGRPARRFKPRSGSEGTSDRGALLRCTCTPPRSPSSRPPHCKSLTKEPAVPPSRRMASGQPTCRAAAPAAWRSREGEAAPSAAAREGARCRQGHF